MEDIIQRIKERGEREKLQEIARIQAQIEKEAETDPLLAAALKEPFGLTRISMQRMRAMENKNAQALEQVMERERLKNLPRSERSWDPNHPNFDPAMIPVLSPWMGDFIKTEEQPIWKRWALRARSVAVISAQFVGFLLLVVVAALVVDMGLSGLLVVGDMLVGG